MMMDLSHTEHQVYYATDFQDLIAAPLKGAMNAVCWTRELAGDFSEIVKKIAFSGNMKTIEEAALLDLQLSEQGRLAREVLLNDLNALRAYGASPVLNLINYYDRDDAHPFFPTDVYSFHVDQSPVPVDTFLCTYYGEPSEILSNAQGTKKILIPAIRNELKKIYHGAAEGFESFLSEYFFDLHYEAKPDARPVSLGVGNLWRLAIDHPGSQVQPCIHRAPREKPGESRLLLIC